MQYPDVISRKEWGAQAFKGSPSRMPAREIIVHHTAGRRDNGSKGDFLSAMRGIQKTHQVGNGWSDIGYHFVIGAGGHIAEGRPFSASALRGRQSFVQGAHVGGKNHSRVGICLMGCFHPDAGAWCDDEVSPEQRAALMHLVAALMDSRDAISAESVFPHSHYSATACCGDLLREELPFVISDAEELLKGGPATGGKDTCPQCSAARGRATTLLQELKARLEELEVILSHEP